MRSALLITCDEVFELLTRGPGDERPVPQDWLEQHLSCCHSCRQLADAMRPATDVLVDDRFVSHGDRQQTDRIMAALRLEPEFQKSTLASRDVSLSSRSGFTREKTMKYASLALSLVLFVGVGMLTAAIQFQQPLSGSLLAAELKPVSNGVPSAAGADYLRSLMRDHGNHATNVHWSNVGRTDSAQSDGPWSTTCQADVAEAPHAIVAGDWRCCSDCHTKSVEEKAAKPGAIVLAQACMVCHSAN